ncbi:Protein STABILIZED1 [Babesia sp. Xinjiang]|uniref:Protein STABILIZED1 n=1 Tax=Babesia sp. Xinjiang TaxID=462227 RepID=UPI000A25B665|nr:Protein STABILIZED1 [Babesia sp. Xinjiang]ORM39405.1 Protein STABILIZED1 [Babesia sp. Xinjiang]
MADTDQSIVTELSEAEAGTTTPSRKEHAVLDLHLNQFLSFIADEYSFLPCAIYRPRIDICLDGKLIYKSRVLSHEDDIFNNAVRIRIQSPTSVLTLKLYECVQLRWEEKRIDNIIRPMLLDEAMDEVLISWCDIELALLVPAKQYKMVCAFRVNPLFLHYNPGGILYYPIYKGRPFIDNNRVCSACRVCAYLASNTSKVHKKALNKYFDFCCDVHEIPTPKNSLLKEDSDINGVRSDGKLERGTENTVKKDDKEMAGSENKVVSMTQEQNYSKELTEEVPFVNKIETLDLNLKKVFFTNEGCTCCKLSEVPRQLRGINYSFCPCCHDYQVCCEHSLQTYYYASVSMKLVSRTPIDFKTELLALMSSSSGTRKRDNEHTDSLCAIVTRAYELHEAIGLLKNHFGLSPGHFASIPYIYVFLAVILIGFVFDGKTLTTSCFLLGFLIMYLRTSSLRQYHRDCGDSMEATKRMTFSGQGLEKTMQHMVEEDEDCDTILETKRRFQRNMKCIPQHEFVDEVKIYTKLYTSLHRRENISIKTLTQCLSNSIPHKLRMRALDALDVLDECVWYVNAMLAIVRRFGMFIAAFFCGMGLLSLRYAFWLKCCIKMLLFVFISSALMEGHPVVRCSFVQMGYLLKYLTMRIYRPRKFVPTGNEPAHYAPGAGRGATAFTTRADFGYSSISTNDPFGKPPPGYIPGRGRGATSFAGGVSRDDVSDAVDLSVVGGEDTLNLENEQLFKDAEYDDEDREADLIYEFIDNRMDERRRSRRESHIRAEVTRQRAEKPTIHQQLAPLKRELESLTMEDWESIPSIGDYSLKRKQQNKREPQYTPAPDSLLYSARAHMQSESSIGTSTPLGFATPLGIMGGSMTPSGTRSVSVIRTPAGDASSLNDLGEARGAVLSITLDKVMDNISGQTVVDPKGYLTDLNAMNIKSDSDIADIKKARTLLKSVIATNPNHAPGWIAAARVEELAGKLSSAREIIAQACEKCGDREDVWLEAARLEKPEYAKAVLAKAVRMVPQSVKIWVEAAKRETNVNDKRRILRKALEFVPNSVRLWKDAISLEDEENAYVMLKRAVECVPDSVDLWLALARLCPYQEAQKVLNEARKQLPTNPDIWITAAKLEESNSNLQMVEKIISRGLENLTKKGVIHVRENWLKQAEQCEANSFVATAQAIVKCTMTIGIDPSMLKNTWLEDGERFEEKGSYACARAIYRSALDHMKTKKSLWLALAELETKHGAPSDVDEVLAQATKYCPNSEILWLMAAKHKWMQGDVDGARSILADAYSKNQEAESISLAAVKLEREHDEFDRARELLCRSREKCGTRKIWMQSVQLERQLGNYRAAIALCDEALNMHPNFDKLWMIAGQMRLELPEPDVGEAIRIFRTGTDQCPWSVALWLLALESLMRDNEHAKARALVDAAKTKIRCILGPRLKHSEKVATVNTKKLSPSELLRIAKAATDFSPGTATSPQEDEEIIESLAQMILKSCDLLWLRAVEIELECGNAGNAYFMMSSALQEFPDSGNLWARAVFLEERNAQNAKAVDALNQCPTSALVVMAAARLFWRDNKVLKARKWFQRAVALDDSNGVLWGTFLAFELDDGDEDAIKEVVNGCTKAEPTSGYDWCRVVKRVANWRLSWPHKLYRYVEEHFGDILSKALERLSPDVTGVLVPGSPHPGKEAS